MFVVFFCFLYFFFLFFFFFQAEDGIRDSSVTGVQTCALPISDRMIEMISGAACELRIGDPRDLATHVGPVIDTEAKQRLDGHIARMKMEARVHFAGSAPGGNYVAPHIFELSDADRLTEEVFGPVLHVVRYP